MPKVTIKAHEIFFLLAGFATLAFLPFLSGGGLFLWSITKFLYFLGVALFIADVIKIVKKKHAG